VSSFQAYLEAKRSVDDRAIDDRVFRAFAEGLAELATDERPLRIVEVGGGIGSMVVRLAERDVLSGPVRYRLIDLDAESIDRAREFLPARLEEVGYAVDRTAAGIAARPTHPRDRTPADGSREGVELEVILETGNAFGTSIDREVDAVIGAAVFDLVDLDRALSWTTSVLEPGGLVYAPLTFDRSTGFAPRVPLDRRLERLYHRHMDDVRDEPGGSRAGRELVGTLEADDRPFEVLGVGGSGWVLRPHGRTGDDGRDDRVVLRHMLETIDGALADYPAETLAPEERRRWVERRRGELEAGALTAVVHHLDVLARLEA
jgi:hypothetical protein